MSSEFEKNWLDKVKKVRSELEDFKNEAIAEIKEVKEEVNLTRQRVNNLGKIYDWRI